jgi:hypothetical protein
MTASRRRLPSATQADLIAQRVLAIRDACEAAGVKVRAVQLDPVRVEFAGESDDDAHLSPMQRLARAEHGDRQA